MTQQRELCCDQVEIGKAPVDSIETSRFIPRSLQSIQTYLQNHHSLSIHVMKNIGREWPSPS